MELERTRPIAAFMAFGTKGDVYPIAAIAAAFACDQKQYHVFLITHSAHENLSCHLKEHDVSYLPISTPPVLSAPHNHDITGSLDKFSQQKLMITSKHRKYCFSAVERIFGSSSTMKGDFILINFFALEGWSLAELFQVRCIIAAPYVVPYSPPTSFERQFRREAPLLYKFLQEVPANKVCWKDVNHWMWPLFTEHWGSWRSGDLNLSSLPFTDPVTCLPSWHDRPTSPLLLYGFSKEVVECPDYWPSNVRVCGFWFLLDEWQISCKKCSKRPAVVSPRHLSTEYEMCSAHLHLQSFLESATLTPPIFIGLSSVGSMGFLTNPPAFLHVLQIVLQITKYRFILFTAGYQPLEEAVQAIIDDKGSAEMTHTQYNNDCFSLFNARLFCFSGTIPYNWLFQRCVAAVHHGGSGTTAAALHAGIPQVVCPFMLDQFYWADRMYWLGVASEPLKRDHLLPENNEIENILGAAEMLSSAISDALAPGVKARAVEIAHRISMEDGVSAAVKNIKEEIHRV